VPYVLYADIDTLLYVTIADNLVNDDTDSPRRHIIDNASSSAGTMISRAVEASQKENVPMVILMRHTLLLGSVGFDINNITDTING